MKRDCEKCTYHVECPITDYYCLSELGLFKGKPEKPCSMHKSYRLNRLTEILLFVSLVIMCAGAILAIVMMIVLLSHTFFEVFGV